MAGSDTAFRVVLALFCLFSFIYTTLAFTSPVLVHNGLKHRSLDRLTMSTGERFGTTDYYREVRSETESWLESCQPLRYKENKVVISKAETIPGIVSDFWRFTHQQSELMRAEQLRQRGTLLENIFFVTPDCPALAKYDYLRRVALLLSASHQGMSQGPGLSCHLSYYHPEHPEKDKGSSPYPTFGIRLQAWTPPSGSQIAAAVAAAVAAADPDKMASPDKQPASQNNSGAANRFRKVADAKDKLERIFKQPAAPSVTEMKESKKATKQRAEPPRTAMEVLQATRAWIARAAAATGAGNAPPDPRVLHLAAAWRQSVSISGTDDEANADVWNEIEEIILRANGVGCDNRKKKLIKPVESISSSDFIDDSELLDPCFSSLLCFPFLHSYDAAAFKKFVRDLSGMLAAAPLKEQFHLELFHPEFVAPRGRLDLVRRTPYPAVHIYYTGLREEEEGGPLLPLEEQQQQQQGPTAPPAAAAAGGDLARPPPPPLPQREDKEEGGAGGGLVA